MIGVQRLCRRFILLCRLSLSLSLSLSLPIIYCSIERISVPGACHLSEMFMFWKESQATVASNIQVSNALMISQLRYGVDPVYTFPMMANGFDAARVSTLTQVLAIEHAYISHITHEDILIETNICKQRVKQEHWTLANMGATKSGVPIRRVAEHLQERICRLLGRILREGSNDLVHQATFNQDNNHTLL